VGGEQEGALIYLHPDKNRIYVSLCDYTNVVLIDKKFQLCNFLPIRGWGAPFLFVQANKKRTERKRDIFFIAIFWLNIG
jgi:hypothetical protein